jgi:hypothetical protein
MLVVRFHPASTLLYKGDSMRLADEIKKAKKELEEARAVPCLCSGFVLQYEGSCQCDHGKAVRAAEAKLQNIINKV